MYKIGDIEINSRVYLAPMAGVTSLAYRKFMKQFGVGVSVTEMVSDCGLIYDNKLTMTYIKTDKVDRPVGIQLFGFDENNIVKAMKIVEETNPDFDFFDINLGCPVHKVTSTGAGSALLKDLSHLRDYMALICKSTTKPVTAKIRLGWDSDSINFKETIKVLEEAGVKAIGLHVRTTKQMYSGKADYEIARNLRDEMSVPLIVSGDIFSLDDAINAIDITHADAVMIARGGVGNPGLVRQIDEYYKTGKKAPGTPLNENIKYLLEYLDLLIEEKGEYTAIKILRGIAPRFLSGYENMKPIKNKISQTINTKQDLLNILVEEHLI